MVCIRQKQVQAVILPGIFRLITVYLLMNHRICRIQRRYSVVLCTKLRVLRREQLFVCTYVNGFGFHIIHPSLYIVIVLGKAWFKHRIGGI